MIHPTADLQKAIHQTLSANAALISTLGDVRIYDHHPEKAAFPYIVLGRATCVDWGTSTEDGNEHLLTIHIWSRRSDRQEIYEIQQLLHDSLHDVQLNAEDHHVINLRQEFCETRTDVESGRLHGAVRFRAITEPKV